MAFLTFRGGIHPYDGKDLSKNCPVEKYLPKGDLAILVSQHIGAPAKPIVKKGDHVLAGQKIADAGGFVSAPLHCVCIRYRKGHRETSDRSTGAMGRLQSSLRTTVCTNLWNMHLQSSSGRSVQGGYLEPDSEKAVLLVMGGAGFPTHVKACTEGSCQDRIISWSTVRSVSLISPATTAG